MCRAVAAERTQVTGSATAGSAGGGSPLHLFDVCPVSFMLEGGSKLDEHPTWKSLALRHMRIADAAEPGTAAIRCPPKHCGKNLWVTKPVRGNDGHDFVVWSDLSDLKAHLEGATGQWLVQKCIEKPLLAYGRKASMRTYMLITDSMDVYTWNAPFFLLATGMYEPIGFSSTAGGPTQSDVATVQLTSTAVQCDCPGFGKHPLPLGNIMYMDEMNKYCNAENRALPKNAMYTHVLPALRALCVDVAKAALPDLRKGTGGRRCFELFAVDVLVDEDLRLWLLDVAENPTLDTATDRHEALVSTVMTQTLCLAVDPLFPSPEVQSEARRALAVDNIAGASGVIKGTEAYGVAPAANGQGGTLNGRTTNPLPPARQEVLIGTLGGAAGTRDYWSHVSAGGLMPPTGVDALAVNHSLTPASAPGAMPTAAAAGGGGTPSPPPIATGFELAFRMGDVPDAEGIPLQAVKEAQAQAEQAARVPGTITPFSVMPPFGALPTPPMGSRVSEAIAPPRSRNVIPWYGICPAVRDKFVKLVDAATADTARLLGPVEAEAKPASPTGTPPPQRGGAVSLQGGLNGRTHQAERARSPPPRALIKDARGSPVVGVSSPPPAPGRRPPPPGSDSVISYDSDEEHTPQERNPHSRSPPRSRSPLMSGRAPPPSHLSQMGISSSPPHQQAHTPQLIAPPLVPLRPDGPAARAAALLARLQAAAAKPGGKPVKPELIAHLTHAVHLLSAAETVAEAKQALGEAEAGVGNGGNGAPMPQRLQPMPSPPPPPSSSMGGPNHRRAGAAPGSSQSYGRAFSPVYGGQQGQGMSPGDLMRDQRQGPHAGRHSQSPRSAAAAARRRTKARQAAQLSTPSTGTGRLAERRGGGTASGRAARQMARSQQQREAAQRAQSKGRSAGRSSSTRYASDEEGSLASSSASRSFSPPHTGQRPLSRGASRPGARNSSALEAEKHRATSPEAEYSSMLRNKLVAEVDAEVQRVSEQVAQRAAALSAKESALAEREAALQAAEARLGATAAVSPVSPMHPQQVQGGSMAMHTHQHMHVTGQHQHQLNHHAYAQSTSPQHTQEQQWDPPHGSTQQAQALALGVSWGGSGRQDSHGTPLEEFVRPSTGDAEVWVEVPSTRHGGLPYFYHAITRDTRWRRPVGPGIIVMTQAELGNAAQSAKAAVAAATRVVEAATPSSHGGGYNSFGPPSGHQQAHSPWQGGQQHSATPSADYEVFRVPGAGTLGSGSIRFNDGSGQSW